MEKNGISYKSHKNVFSYSLENNIVGHENFSEIIFLIRKFDYVLRHRLGNITSKSWIWFFAKMDIFQGNYSRKIWKWKWKWQKLNYNTFLWILN